MKYVKVHPALEEKPAMEDFENGERQWSHLIRDADGDRLLFGDFYFGDCVDFDFNWFRLQVGGESGYLKFTWPQARKLGETIIALANKHEERG